MGQAKSDALKTYRQEVAAFVRAALDARRWTPTDASRHLIPGRTTWARALDAEHTTDYTALLALAKVTGAAIPESLSDAAAAIHLPPTKAPPVPDEEVAVLVQHLRKLTPEERAALLRNIAQDAK